MGLYDYIINQVGGYAEEHGVYVVWCFDCNCGEPTIEVHTEKAARFAAEAHCAARHHDDEYDTIWIGTPEGDAYKYKH